MLKWLARDTNAARIILDQGFGRIRRGAFRPERDRALGGVLLGNTQLSAASAAFFGGRMQQTSDLQLIPLSRLEASDDNVRKTPAGAQDLAILKASIAAHGLLENLIVRPVGPDPEGAARYAVVAGSRRLTALQELAREGRIDPAFAVPCRILDGEDPAGELSLAENVVRVGIHPADQVEAFAALVESGSTVSEIAVRFGVSERTVEQRLRLGNVAEEIREAYRSGEIDMKTLEAFTLTTDQKRQLAVWEGLPCRGKGSHVGAWMVRNRLTESRLSGDDALAVFVGLEAYTAAGGRVTRDLFARDDPRGLWFDDPELLRKLASDQLEAEAEALRPSWKWVEAQLDVGWEERERYGKIRPEPGQPTEAERAELDQLGTRFEELEQIDDDEWTDEMQAEHSAIEARQEEINLQVSSRAVYAEEDRDRAGCIVTVDYDGSLTILEGLVRPDDMPKEAEQSPTQAGITPPRIRLDRAAKARKDAGVGIGLADDLRSIRTTVVKSHLWEDFGAAFDLMLFQFVRKVFGSGSYLSYAPHSLDIDIHTTPTRPFSGSRDDRFGEVNVAEKELAAKRGSLPLEWLQEKDDGVAFGRLCALSVADKQRLFAACVAQTLKGQLAFEPDRRPELEAVISRLNIDFASLFRPPEDLFWQRISKAHMLSIARDTLGETWAKSHAKDKKKELAQSMADAFAAGDDLPAGLTREGRAAALAWVPPGFAPAVGPSPAQKDSSAGEATPPIPSESEGDPDGE